MQIRSTKQYQMIKMQMTETRSRDAHLRAIEIYGLFRTLNHSSFEFVSDFEIRISDFCPFGNVVSEAE